MITSVKIKNFKSLRDVTLELGVLNIFIGTNAGGKSNFFDALRFLQGVGYGFTFNEILNGKPRSASNEVWTAIRGGSSNAAFKDGTDDPHITFEVTNEKNCKLSLTFSPTTNTLIEETFIDADGNPIYFARQERVTNLRFVYNNPRTTIPIKNYSLTSPVISQIVKDNPSFDSEHLEAIRQFLRELGDMQHLDPSLEVLRDYSKPAQAQRMGERGENFAALVNTLIAKPEDKTAYLSWLNHLRPEEIEDVRILPGAASDLLFALKESGQVFPAPVLSDGTLRFAALAAALFQPDMPGILTIEEIENGIHPARLRLLIELLRTQAAQGCAQMMVTTHSPALLAWLRPEEYRHTFWCQRDDETGASNITPLSKIPHFTDAVKSTSLSSLLTEGWLEGAL